jgi:hypothetical protein
MLKQKLYTDLIIIEKYEKFLNYMYPIAQNIPRKHGIVKEMFIHSLLEQVKLFSIAGKSNQVSKLYICDAGLQELRFWLRFLEDSKRKLITPKQHQVGSLQLEEVGKILGSWIKTLNRSKDE